MDPQTRSSSPLSHPPPVAPVSARSRKRDVDSAVGMVAAMTMAVWMVCLAIGVWGLWLQYPTVHLPVETRPVDVKQIRVDLAENSAASTDDVAPNESSSAAQSIADTPPPPVSATVETPPDAPPLLAVAAPNPAITFAVPTNEPSRIVAPKNAAPAANPVAPPVAAPLAQAGNTGNSSIHHLVFGRGEGAQAQPEYPPEAIDAGQEGVVVVRFVVTEAGRVTDVEIATPSPWPMLNQSALRAVRDRWHFKPGQQQLCEVPIRFQIAKQKK